MKKLLIFTFLIISVLQGYSQTNFQVNKYKDLLNKQRNDSLLFQNQIQFYFGKQEYLKRQSNEDENDKLDARIIKIADKITVLEKKIHENNIGIDSLSFYLSNNSLKSNGGTIGANTSIALFISEVDYTIGYHQSYSLDLLSALNNAVLPNSQIDFFYKIREGYLFKYFDVKASGSILSDNLRSLTANSIGFAVDTNTDTLLNSFQQYNIPTASELIQLAKLKGYVGINVYNNKPYGFDENFDHPHLFTADLGVHFIYTPLTLDPALDAVSKTLANINRKIRELQSESEGGLGNPLSEDALKKQIEELTYLADVVENIAQEVKIPSIDKFSNLLFYLSPSATYAYSPSDKFNIQLYGQYFLPLKKLKLSQGIYDLQETEYLSSDFGSASVLEELSISTQSLDEIESKEDYTPKMIALGGQVALGITDEVFFHLRAQYLYTFPNKDFKESELSENNKLAFFGLGLSYVFKGETKSTK
jgi:hypothetical protein